MDDKILRSKNETNKNTTKLTKIFSKEYIGTMLRITKKTFKMKNCLMNYF